MKRNKRKKSFLLYWCLTPTLAIFQLYRVKISLLTQTPTGPYKTYLSIKQSDYMYKKKRNIKKFSENVNDMM